MARPAEAARERLLPAFTRQESMEFLRLLEKLAETFNGVDRTLIARAKSRRP